MSSGAVCLLLVIMRVTCFNTLDQAMSHTRARDAELSKVKPAALPHSLFSGNWDSLPEIKWLDHEADHSTPSCAVLQTSGSELLLPCIPS
jgi:hypothetical protein